MKHGMTTKRLKMIQIKDNGTSCDTLKCGDTKKKKKKNISHL